MEKQTLLAVVLSILVLVGFYVIQGIFFPPQGQVQSGVSDAPAQSGSVQTPGAVQAPPQAVENFQSGEAGGFKDETVPSIGDEFPAESESAVEKQIFIETDLIRVALSTAGGDIVSYKLKEHTDKEDLVEMILPGSAGAHAFTVAFGGVNAKPVGSNFRYRQTSPLEVEFAREFSLGNGGGHFILVKRYKFKPKEYMFELSVLLDGGNSMSAFNFAEGSPNGGGAAYTLGFGPQIGPRFEKLDQRYEYRNYLTFEKDKNRVKQEKVSDNGPTIIRSQPSWAAITGKYFTFIALPYANQYEVAFSNRPEPGIPSASRLFITRPAQSGSRLEDVYRFYLGPKNQEALTIYDTGKNDYNLKETGLFKVADSVGFGAILSPLEKLLKLLLTFFNGIVHNYGVAIIMITVLVKALLFPLTKKGSESTLKMQALAPKIKEIQAKYKDDPRKMQAAVGEFYKKEGYNPLSGCLPMLLQIPIFFAMYNLFNSHFDLRGAMFIPGWIPDLSLPESIFNFAPARIPLLGWSDIRLLPFLYVGSQLLYGKVTQTPDQQGNAQMKMMLYAMPVVFFFVLYDVPSGLLLYWIMSNLLTLVQQLIINKRLAKKRAAIAAAEPAKPVIAPPKKHKKR